jgi:cell fate regulator YaaT (PSP1 superfamily)
MLKAFTPQVGTRIVETARGIEYGDTVVGRALWMKKPGASLKKVIRKATAEDLSVLKEIRQRKRGLCHMSDQDRRAPAADELIDVEYTLIGQDSILLYR